MTEVLRLRKHLAGLQPLPAWPDGVGLAPVSAVAPEALHAILVAGYANGFGDVADLDTWWPSITEDSEYDPELVFVAVDADGAPIGFALCWPGFVKDIAVTASWRGRGLGEALLRTLFLAFQEQGLAHVDLKVISANAGALRLYRRVGMAEVAL